MSPLRHFAETMSNKGIIKNLNIFIPISAAHLYDSVILYAKALDKLIRDEQKEDTNGTLDIEKLVRQLARDGE